MASIIKADEWQNSAGIKVGTVLQVVNVYSSGTTTTTATYPGVGLAGMATSITIRQGSIIFAIVRAGAYGANSSAWASTGRIILDRGGSIQAHSEHMGTITMSEQCYTHFISHHSGAMNAGTYAYTVKGASTTGGSISFNRDGNLMGQLTLMEIAA